ncbi:hypothetical protein QI045_12615 [Staphylococcus saprophyticus]|nr:hypothetical protein [Staphylococcus saprophyticus]
MKNIKKILFTVVFVTLLAIINTSIASAVSDEGIGVENDFSNTSENSFSSLPSDEELQNMTEENKASIVESSDQKKIKSGKGGLYKTYEKEIEDYLKASEKSKTLTKDGVKHIRKTFKNFNTDTGEVESKNPFDFDTKFNNVFIKLGSNTLQWVTEPLSKFTLKPGDVLDSPSAKPLKDAFNNLTDIAVALFFTFQIIKIILMRTIAMETQGQVAYEKTVKLVTASILLGLYDPLYKLALNIQYLLTNPILRSVGIEKDFANILAAKTLIMGDVVMLIILPLIAVLLFVLTLSLYYSLAYLIILYVIGPLAITTIVNDELEFWSLWVRKLVSRILTLMLQSICIALSLATLFRLKFSMTESTTDIFLGIAFLFVGLAVPKLLENFGDSSGGGRTTMLMFRSMGRRK